ncbi:hypothetical protein C8A01DRAFT_31707 [Parachaetomium inaequale]|uniref:Uncharacterized protein n=1 Tax=Parachaetomium inaequale TaxID=2588326 RepID=A0AAN6PN55_9PEZI|nr:hypothetical protein C8A01DRAFT_31707 [Parachaetomium inaequale]
MSLPPTPNHFTWERIDIGDLDQDLQHAEHGSDSPNDTPTPPPYSGYARVPPFQGQYQPGRAPDEHDKKDEGDGGDGFIKTALFPLPPTVAENHSHLSPYRYNTFPPPLGPPSTPNSDRETRPHGREQGYFETLDFSDYLPPANPGSANLQQHHLGEKLPSGIYSPRMMPLFESATMDSCTTWQREYVPRAWRDSTIETQARRLYGGYGAVGGRSLDVDCGRTAVGRFALGDKRRKWRAMRFEKTELDVESWEIRRKSVKHELAATREPVELPAFAGRLMHSQSGQ